MLGNLCMVYQFLTDVFWFHVHFSSMQYWGIFVSMMTFVIDIYMTLSEDNNRTKDVEDVDKKEEGELLDRQSPNNNVELTQIPEPATTNRVDGPQLRRNRVVDTGTFRSSGDLEVNASSLTGASCGDQTLQDGWKC